MKPSERLCVALDFPTRREVLDSFLVGSLLLGVGNGFVVFGQALEVPSGVAAILIAMTPLWFALLGWLYLRQHLPRLVVGAILVGFAGTALLIWPAGDGANHYNPLGILALLLAEIGWAHGSIYSHGRAQLPASPLTASGIRVGTAAVTTRGLGEAEMDEIAKLIAEVLAAPEDTAVAASVRERVRSLCRRFPLYEELR